MIIMCSGCLWRIPAMSNLKVAARGLPSWTGKAGSLASYAVAASTQMRYGQFH